MRRELAVMSVYEPTNSNEPQNDELSRSYTSHVGNQRELVRVGCFVRDRDLGSVPNNLPMTRLDRRGFARSAMWTHYAEGQTGVCLVLDVKRCRAPQALHRRRTLDLSNGVTPDTSKDSTRSSMGPRPLT